MKLLVNLLESKRNLLKSVQDNIADLEDVKSLVLSHYMCFKFEETEQHYIVIFPYGDFGREAHGSPIGGCRVSKGLGKIKALKTLLEKLEYYWESSFPGYVVK